MNMWHKGVQETQFLWTGTISGAHPGTARVCVHVHNKHARKRGAKASDCLGNRHVCKASKSPNLSIIDT